MNYTEQVEKYGSARAASKALGIPRSTFRSRMKKETEPFLGEAAEGIGFPAGDVSSYWVKSDTGSFLVKKPKEGGTENLAETIADALSEFDGCSLKVKSPKNTAKELLTTYPIADLHIGMLAWGEESGDDWDLKIAEGVILDSMRKLVNQSPDSETALLINLGDFFHINDSKNMTPGSGNILDVDSRYQKVIYAGVKIMLSIIDLALQKHKKVVVRNVRGNHDPDATVALNVALKLYFSNNKRVTIDDSPKQFSYYRHGTTLLGFYHGHTAKAERAAMHMACANPIDWGKSKYRMMYHGHIHHETRKEIGNVIVESFQTLAAKDEYAASHGYWSGRSLSSITIHVERGEISRARVNL